MSLLLVYSLQSLSIFTIGGYAKSLDVSISINDDTDGALDDTNDIDDESNEPHEYTEVCNVSFLHIATNHSNFPILTKLVYNDLCSHFPLIHTEVPSPPPDSVS